MIVNPNPKRRNDGNSEVDHKDRSLHIGDGSAPIAALRN
jgi:hypothetical protein